MNLPDINRVAMKLWLRERQVGWDALTDAERAVLITVVLWNEVGNGGFHQYYYNSSGNDALEAPEAFRKIRAAKIAKVVQKANRLFGTSGPDRDQSKRQAQLAGLSEESIQKMESLDSLVYDDFYLELRMMEFAGKNGMSDE